MPATYDIDRLHIETSGPEETEGTRAEEPLTLILLHGWGSSAQVMRPSAQALSRYSRVLNIDLPGHGQSPPPPEPWGVPEHAQLVHECIQQRAGGGPVVLIGHSNGGRISLYMAADERYSHALKALVLISPSGIRRERSADYHIRRGIARTLKAPINMLPEGDIKDYMVDWLHHTPIWKLLGSSDYRALEGVMRDTFVKTVNHYVEDRLNRIDIPCLLFWGENDDAVSRRQMKVLEDGLADAGLVVLEDAGHYGFLDDPDTFLAATEHFLETLEDSDVEQLQE